MTSVPPAGSLPDKKYFKIGEVAELVGVEPHVLRYWETQFPQVRPHKARSGHRLYRRREVETLLVIRELLHVQRFTIAGARQALRQPGGAQALVPRSDASRFDTPSLEGEAIGATDDGLVEIEAEGLDDDQLRLALERDGAAAGAQGELLEVEVAAEGDDAAARDGAPVRVELSPRQPARAGPPVAAVHVGALPLRARQRSLLEEALASARAIVAVLDREDARERRPQA